VAVPGGEKSDHRFFSQKTRFEDEGIEDLLPSADAGPDAVYVRSLLWEELEQALAELPKEQRAVFIAHEIEGRSFKELAAETGVSVNTLLARKRYAVLHLRERLKDINEEMMGETK
jgi:RNA polymerase sigma factor (sigma-70 family)